MAGIDKTYVNNWEDYKKIKSFFTKQMRNKQKSDLGYYFGYNTGIRRADFKGNNEVVLWNTPSVVDAWLANNCDVPFIIERLKEQYPENWIGWRELDFQEQGYVCEIKKGESYISPFKRIDKDYAEVYDEILVFGTTLAHDLIYEAFKITRGAPSFHRKDKILVTFKAFGQYIEYDGENYTVDGEIISYLYFPNQDFGKDYSCKFITELNIKHSYNFKDSAKYEPEQIVMSHEKDCFNVDMYKDFDKDNMSRYIYFLPEHIRKYIK